jgi:putative ABC transport system permease protein
MTVFDCLAAAQQSLRANLLRSILTSLGIIIGVGAVIAMVGIGAGAEQRVSRLIANLGSNIIVVLNGSRTRGGVRGGSGTQLSLTESDAKAIQREIPVVQVSAPAVRGAAQVVFGDTNWNTAIYGITDEYFTARDWHVESGRRFTATELHGAGKVALIGATIVRELFGGGDPIGQTIRIKRVPFIVIGVLKAKGQTPWGRDQDDVIFLPLSAAKKRVLGGREVKGDLVGSITVKAWTAAGVDVAVRQVTALLRQRHHIRNGQLDDFTVRNISSFLSARAESSRVMTLLLASVAAISLIVGGIGIMNIMLVSVTERTREIGLRMAVGARRFDIMSQFVVEAITLSLIGGLIGVTVGVGGSILLARTSGWPIVIEPQSILVAFGFAAAVGVFFGFYPARKASRLDPIEALRHE